MRIRTKSNTWIPSVYLEKLTNSKPTTRTISFIRVWLHSCLSVCFLLGRKLTLSEAVWDEGVRKCLGLRESQTFISFFLKRFAWEDKNLGCFQRLQKVGGFCLLFPFSNPTSIFSSAYLYFSPFSWCWGSNPGPRAYKVSILPTELHPNPLYIVFIHSFPQILKIVSCMCLALLFLSAVQKIWSDNKNIKNKIP